MANRKQNKTAIKGQKISAELYQQGSKSGKGRSSSLPSHTKCQAEEIRRAWTGAEGMKKKASGGRPENEWKEGQSREDNNKRPWRELQESSYKKQEY